MATIGTFTKTANGDFTGTIKTLTLNVKAKFVPTEGDSERGPDYRIFAGPSVEFGAAWKKTARETGRDYLERYFGDVLDRLFSSSAADHPNPVLPLLTSDVYNKP